MVPTQNLDLKKKRGQKTIQRHSENRRQRFQFFKKLVTSQKKKNSEPVLIVNPSLYFHFFLKLKSFLLS